MLVDVAHILVQGPVAGPVNVPMEYDFEKARTGGRFRWEVLRQHLKIFTKMFPACAGAQYELGKLEEVEGDWEAAANRYAEVTPCLKDASSVSFGF